MKRREMELDIKIREAFLHFNADMLSGYRRSEID